MNVTTCTIAALSSRSTLHARSVSAPRIWRLPVGVAVFFPRPQITNEPLSHLCDSTFVQASRRSISIALDLASFKWRYPKCSGAEHSIQPPLYPRRSTSDQR